MKSMMTSTLLRNSVSRLTPYIASETIESVQRQAGLAEVIKLSSNENPLGASPAATAAMVEALRNVHAYPDAHATELYQRLAQQYGVRPDQILLGNGADNVISVIGATFLNPGDEVVYCAPTFPSYRTITVLAGGAPVEVPLTESGHFDLEAMHSRITARTKLVFICNPNNPTGTAIDPHALQRFIEAVPKHAVVVVDEAYIEFVDAPGTTGVDLVKAGHHVIVLRTFSKIYGLAGVRIGYAIATPDLINPMHTVREPFTANRIAVAGAVAALDDEEFITCVRRDNQENRSWLIQELSSMGMDVIPSVANFVFVDTHQDARALCDRLRERGILLRPGNAWGRPTSVRITIGTKSQMQRLAAVLRDITNG